MAVAAYSALLSLADVLNNVQHHVRHRLHLDVDRIQSLQEKVQYLQDFLKVHSQRKSQELEDLAGQITVVADDVEDIIDLHVVYQLHEGSQNDSHHLQATPSSFCEDIDKVIIKIDSTTKELMMIKEDWGNDVQEQKAKPSLPASSSTGLPSTDKDSTVVGFDEHLLHIVHELAKDESNLCILPIVGMEALVFDTKGCSHPELEKIGKEITKACRGLPLAIVAIAGLLANSNMQQQYWESIAKNVNSFANSQDNDYCLKVLSLSYNYLPLHLKACFLYTSTFPEDAQIKVSELVRIWIGEGFVKSVRGQLLEETANRYLEDLVATNLILIGERTVCGKIGSCSIHDLLRDLCLREFDKEHFVRNLKSPFFSGQNYDYWAIKMKTYFQSQKLWELVEEGVTLPEDSSTSSSAEKGKLENKKAKDSEALYYIQTTVADHIFPRISVATSTKEAWSILQKEYQGSAKVRIIKLQTLRRDFENMKMKDSETIDEYYSKVRELVNQLKAYGEDIPEKRVVEKLLISVTEKYDPIVTTIEETKDITTLTVTELVGSLEAYEKRRSRREENSLENAFQSKLNMRSQNSNRKEENFKSTMGDKKKQNMRPCCICKRTNHLEKIVTFKENHYVEIARGSDIWKKIVGSKEIIKLTA
ncbi:putative disease resistance protein [Sesamum angolense]|uniref:Disease resistance protein n=1 Tax=Sesamum angolense TaxID=2727404 RepID=A0AAE1W493_9LAMI|nr:putative disease resistance protein [Sesamum angolense]